LRLWNFDGLLVAMKKRARSGRTGGATLRPPSDDLRADARRNREKLIEAAAPAFAEHGTAASLEEIARRAGVGIGTLYRHFPTREHLVEVVYGREVEQLIEAADELAKREAPDVALEQWMLRFVGYIAAKRGMAESLRQLYASNSTLFAKASGAVPQTLQRLVESAAEAGLIRQDIQSADLLQALSGLYSAPDTPDWRERSRRLVGLLMDGLRTVAAKKRGG
jgi:AcrR family transcriptional regulator